MNRFRVTHNNGRVVTCYGSTNRNENLINEM